MEKRYILKVLILMLHDQRAAVMHVYLQNQYLCNRRTGNTTQLFRTSKEILVPFACFSFGVAILHCRKLASSLFSIQVKITSD